MGGPQTQGGSGSMVLSAVQGAGSSHQPVLLAGCAPEHRNHGMLFLLTNPLHFACANQAVELSRMYSLSDCSHTSFAQTSGQC